MVRRNTSKSTDIPKLLAPAGDMISLRAALQAGADEIFFGIRGFNMRAGAGNFELSDMKKISAICKEYGAKAYLALNIIVYNSESAKVKAIIANAKKFGINAVIAWDMSIIAECVRQKMDVHLSTQASVSNIAGVEFYKKMIPNLTRVVLARECSLTDVKDIIKQIKRKRLGVEIEAFIHGAMCVSISGRCFMSQEVFGKSANRGECLQPCRRLYSVGSKETASNSADEANKMDCSCATSIAGDSRIITDVEEGFQFEVGKDYVMSPKDLCTIKFIDQLIDAGIASFKIEGRGRSPEYVASVVSAYRKVMDYYLANKSKILRSSEERAGFERQKQEQFESLSKVYNRGFSNGFYLGKPISEWCKSYGSLSTTSKEYLGRVINYYPKNSVAEIKLESADLNQGDNIMIQGVTTGVQNQLAESMQVHGSPITSAKKGTRVGLKVDFKVRMNDKIYRLTTKR